jgi:hypothetical protein
MTSASFPEIEAERAVRRMLREGRSIKEDQVNDEVRNQLSERNLIEVTEREYLVCADPSYPIDERHPDRSCRAKIWYEGPEKVHECNTCGNVIADVEEGDRPVYTEYTFSRNPEGIYNYLKGALSALSNVATVDVAGKGALGVQLRSGSSLDVVVPQWAEQKFLMRGSFFSDPTLYVHVGRHRELPTVLEEAQHLHLADLLVRSTEWIQERLETASIPVQGRPPVHHLVDQFDATVDRHVDPDVTLQQGDFFEYFCRDLLDYVHKHPKKTNEYLRSLRRLRDTAFGEMHIQVGGSGNTDIISVDKFEMFNQLCAGSFITDAKCKLSTGLTMDDVLTVNGHLTTNEWEADRAVIILASEKVTDNAWNFIAEARQNNDAQWKIMLIPKFALLELMHAVDAEQLLDAVMDEDRNGLFYPGDDRYESIAAQRTD